ncbi:putative protein [Aquifex aeolicus VF5]|uniref:Uncharacterized protein aq_900 n=2 Tax=Aquifex aeolicus TaxID=63363 RepID=Y900_AQUAE|nr:RecName: Full=Uncharacterized protein aq_900 [Aquifex aeolicus VF5]AAC07018.1 putative protein [Aquifex aeolicus VF5]
MTRVLLRTFPPGAKPPVRNSWVCMRKTESTTYSSKNQGAQVMVAVMKFSEDIPLTTLLETAPECEEILMKYGLQKIKEDGVYEIVVPRLTLRGFITLMNLKEKERDELVSKLEEIYNKKLSGG